VGSYPATSKPAPVYNAPWLFGLVSVSYGFNSAVSFLLTPYLLRKYGVGVDRIAGVVAVALIPTAWNFLWSPLADCGVRRRSCVLFSAIAAALAASVAIGGIRGSLTVLTLLLFLSTAFSGLQGSATGGLLTHLPPSRRGQGAGWSQAGNIGGGAIGGGVFIWLADHAALPVVAMVIATMIVLPSLAALLIHEAAPARHPLGPLARALFHDLRDLFLSRRTWLGLLFFLAPAGSFAVGNLISGLGPDYRTSGTEVLWVTGIGGGLLAAGGSFLGGMVADRINRMVTYSLTGGMAALLGVYMALAPATGVTYGLGYGIYAIASGFSYCMFTALVLDVVGHRASAAASGYAVLNASGNLAISYMVWLDGWGYKHWGARGLMGTDALANGASAVILLLVAIAAREYWNRSAAELLPHTTQVHGR
jgi:MFS family permease